MVGKTLGPYKIIEQLGAGGMGEVYLGEDTRLGRKVAIKVLPEEYASDPDRGFYKQCVCDFYRFARRQEHYARYRAAARISLLFRCVL